MTTPPPAGAGLTDWADLQGLTCLNPSDSPTWFNFSSQEAQLSVIDLAFINKVVAFSSQIGDLDVSDRPLPLTDYAALTLTFYPITSLHLIPPPAPAGYNANPKFKDNWQKELCRLETEWLTPTADDNLDTLIACYVLTLPLLFLILPHPFTPLVTRLLIPGTALPWSQTSLTSSQLILWISSHVLPLNQLPFAPLCAVGPILLIALPTSAPDALMETPQSFGSPLEGTLLTPIP
jgi:hypothetical protein